MDFYKDKRDPEQIKRMVEMKQLSYLEINALEGKEELKLSKEEAKKYLLLLEAKKVQSMKLVAVQKKEFQQKMLAMEQQKAFDEIFIEFGVETY